MIYGKLTAIAVVSGLVLSRPPGGHAGDGPKPDDAPSGLSVVATADKAEYDMLEPIKVRVTLRNRSEKHILLQPDYCEYSRCNVVVKSKTPTGRLIDDIPRTNFHDSIKGGCGSLHLVGLRPKGGEMSDVVVANLVSDMTRGGTYTIVVEVRSSLSDQPRIDYMRGPPHPKPIIARSEPIEVKVNGDFTRLTKKK